ncbi:MAG: hypothetical protein SP1CHLAM54_11210 [Chlamydiia bacterium]|nr:hypothetical protein [Chlamydiia bacterium]MCH9616024.1 hypothetical protein [Chlamydiia bacterium]MCH9629047.1 hypothetical protein [Chlamydiia bacterium]
MKPTRSSLKFCLFEYEAREKKRLAVIDEDGLMEGTAYQEESKEQNDNNDSQSRDY